MKQTKKLTYSQRNFLLKKHIDIDGVRVVQEKKEALIIMNKDGEVISIDKD